MCGITSPTNPIEPTAETETPARITTIIIPSILVRFVFTPKFVATSSPIDMSEIDFPSIVAKIIVIRIIGTKNFKCSHLTPATPPAYQNAKSWLKS